MATKITAEEQASNNARLAAEARARRGEGHAAPAVEAGDCPDPDSEDFPKQLHALFGRRLWAIGSAASTTAQDVVAGYAATRLAAGVGKEAPRPKAFHIPMASLLGCAPEPEVSKPPKSVKRVKVQPPPAT